MRERFLSPIFIYPLLFLLLMLAYVNTKEAAISDSMWAVHIADSIMSDGDVNLVEFKSLIEANNYYAVSQLGDRLVPYPPVGNSVIVIPILWLRAQFDQRIESLHEHLLVSLPSDLIVSEYQIFAASVVIAISALVLAAIGRRELTWSRTLVLVLVYAFGTSAYSTGTRGLWNHGPSLLMLILVLWAWHRADKNSWWLVAAGLFLAVAYVIRPTNSVAVLVWSIYALWRYRLTAWKFFGGAGLIALSFFAFSWFTYGHLLPPYYAAGRLGSPIFWEAIAGHVISPGKGLLIFSPVLIFVLVGIWFKHKERGLQAIDWALIVIIGLHWVVISSFIAWSGSAAYGPRYFTDVIPYLCYFLIPVLKRLSFDNMRWRIATTLFTLTAVASIIIHFRGAYESFIFDWGSTPASLDFHLHRLWDWSDIAYLRRKSDQPLFTIPREYTITDEMFVDESFTQFTIGNWSDEAYHWRANLPFSMVAKNSIHVHYVIDNEGRRWLESAQPLEPSSAHWLAIDYRNDPSVGSFGAIEFEVFSADSGERVADFIVPASYYGEGDERFDRLGHIIMLPDDIRVLNNGDRSNLYALHGSGWYGVESFEQYRWRWAQSPAHLFVYSGRRCRARIVGTLSNIYDPAAENGRGDSGTLRITTERETVALDVIRDAQFGFEVSLNSGWNKVSWDLAAGNFRPKAVDPASADGRTLSFALAPLMISGCDAP